MLAFVHPKWLFGQTKPKMINYAAAGSQIRTELIRKLFSKVAEILIRRCHKLGGVTQHKRGRGYFSPLVLRLC